MAFFQDVDAKSVIKKLDTRTTLLNEVASTVNIFVLSLKSAVAKKQPFIILVGFSGLVVCRPIALNTCSTLRGSVDELRISQSFVLTSCRVVHVSERIRQVVTVA